MANQEHLAILAKGVEAWKAWRISCLDDQWERELLTPERPDLRGADLRARNLREHDLTYADLREADLRDAHLTGADLRNAQMSGVDLRDADMRRAQLGHLDLRDVGLEGAELSRANLRYAKLTDTCLERVRLIDTDLSGADVNGVNFSHARVGGTTFGNLDLRYARGLEEIIFEGPCTIGIDSVYLSDGTIPASFLRGCGVPDNFITYMKSLTRAAFDFYSCFISYSTEDQAFADRLYADLQARGVRCWFAPRDIQGGKKIHEQIDEAIRVYDKLLLILSDASMNSNWVKTEIANARAREQQQNRQMLFPIALVPFERVRRWTCFNADTGIDSACEVREYHIPDFSNWKDHDAYSTAFERLVRDLKATADTAK